MSDICLNMLCSCLQLKTAAVCQVLARMEEPVWWMDIPSAASVRKAGRVPHVATVSYYRSKI